MIKKVRNNIKIISILVCILLISFGIIFYFKEKNKNAYLGNLDLSFEATINDEKISDEEFEYFYGLTLNTYMNKAYSYLGTDYQAYLGFTIKDGVNTLEDQECTLEGYEDKTWAYYFAESAGEYMREVRALYDEATKEEITLNKDELDLVNQGIEDIKTYCKDNDIKVNDYIRSTFGKNATEEKIKSYNKIIALANKYSEKLDNELKYSDEDLEKLYEENKDNIDTINIRYFAFDKDEESKANEFKKAVEDGASFNEIAYNYSSEDVKEKYSDENSTLRENLRYEDLPDYLKDVLFSNQRYPGEVLVVKGANSYDVVLFLEREKPTYKDANFRMLYVKAEVDEGATASTGAQMEEAKNRGKELLENYKKEEQSEVKFIEYVKSYSEDEESKNKEGLFENVSKREVSSDIQKWLYSEERGKGDVELLKSTNGYCLIYFLGFGEFHYINETKNVVGNSSYSDKLDELIKDYKVNIKQK